MALKSENKVLGDWLKHEYEQYDFTRQVETIKGGGSDVTFKTGTVLSKKTADGKLYDVTDDASDGTQTAYGILIHDTLVPANTDTKAAVLVRGPAVVDSNQIILNDAGISGDATDVAEVIATLASLNIIARAGVSTVGPV